MADDERDARWESLEIHIVFALYIAGRFSRKRRRGEPVATLADCQGTAEYLAGRGIVL